MLDNRSKLILAICLLVGIPLLVWRFVGIIRIIGDSHEQSPVRTLRITLDPSQREELFGQFRKFANKHDFQFDMSDYGTGGQAYLIQMSRDDITITVSINRHDPKIASLGFFAKYPGYPVDEETIENLLNDLKGFISEIPNVTITDG